MARFVRFVLTLVPALMAVAVSVTAQQAVQDVTPSKEIVPAAPTSPAIFPEAFSKIVGTFAAEGINPVVMQVTSVAADGSVALVYKYRGNQLPVAKAVATLTGNNAQPIRLDVVAGESSGVKWELYYSDTFGGMLKGPVYYGERRGENTLYRQK